MANGGIIGPVQTPVVTPAGSQSELITGITSPNPAFAVQPATTVATVMVIAGGAAGGVGGGGAGGLRIVSSHPVPSSPFPITIGAGGTRSTPGAAPTAGPGNNTSFGSDTPLNATGGGGKIPGRTPGTPGGSGGGANSQPGTPEAGGLGNAGSYSPPEGNDGGSSNVYNGSGGGGSAAAGNNVTSWPGLGSTGGAGTNTAPTFGAAPQPYYPAKSPGPTNAYFAGGGGGGGTSNTPQGGTGGGGTGLSAPPASFAGNGDTNSGSGGGGNYGLGANHVGNGGSGMVIVKELAVTIPESIAASGVWTMQEVYGYRKSGDWLGA